jgi:pyrroloquinoline quinone biosynthesis protein B
MGNPASGRDSVRHGNHDVHFQPLKIRVLGSAAGGGFPQWNCSCPNCKAYRAGTLQGRSRTQSSIVVTGGDSWVLVNASPDILTQLRANPDLQPGRKIRDSALTAIILIDGQVDHTTGLYMLREAARPWQIWCTASTYADLTRGNPILSVLSHYCGVEHHRIDLSGAPFAAGTTPGVRFRALPVAGKPAPYSPNRDSPLAGDNIALLIEDVETGRTLLYAPGLSAIDARVWEAMQSAACVLVDGTFWSDDEMIRLGVSRKYARDIGHLPQSGTDGMLEWLGRLPPATRKILIHINNTNPILDESSPEAIEVGRRGVEIAWDGMEIVL